MRLTDKIKEKPSKLFVVIILVVFAINAFIPLIDPDNWMAVFIAAFAYLPFFYLTKDNNELAGDVSWIGATISLTFLIYVQGFQVVLIWGLLGIYIGVIVVLYLYLRF